MFGGRAEDAFRLSIIRSTCGLFWCRRVFDPGAPLNDPRFIGLNWFVGSITTLAILLLFWPELDTAFDSVRRLWRPAKAAG